MVLLLLGLRATNQLLTITAVCVIEMADAYGAGNAFPKEASNTDDWLDAIGLVRPCSVQARCRITSPIVYKCGVCDPQSRCKEALAGMSLVDIVNMTDSERRERVPIDGQRKRLVAFLRTHTHTHTHTRARSPCPRLTYAHLWPLTAAQVLALQALNPSTSPPQVKYNSTSSLYIDSTITKPCAEEMIFCVSVVLHDRINEGEQATAEATAKGETLPRFKVDSKDLMQVREVDLMQVVDYPYPNPTLTLP